jgi:hypothetical protein
VAIALVALTVALRFLAPHHLLPQYAHLPLVPVTTGLMFLAALVGLLRRTVTLRLTPQLLAQVALLLWVAVCAVIDDGAAGLGIVKKTYPLDLVYVATVMMVVDRVSRLKIVAGVAIGCFVVIGALALPQVWGDRFCAEWKEGDMANLRFDGRPCAETTDCFRNQPKERLFPGIGPRNFRCERRGPFGVAAYVGRVRWVGLFHDSNNLGSSMSLVVPLAIALLWGGRSRWARWSWPPLVLFLTGVVFVTGSRGAQLGLVIGLGAVAWGLWGRRAVAIGGALGVVALVAALAVGKLNLRAESKFEASTEVSDRYRRDAMSVGYRLWGANPLFGVGHQNFESFHIIDPHNAFLCVAAEAGTGGLLVYALGVWLTLRAGIWARRRARQAGRADLQRLATGVLASTIGGTLSLTLFLSTYDKLSWLFPICYTTGLVRAVEQELPGEKFRLVPLDPAISTAGSLVLVGVIYVVLLFTYTVS